MTLKERCQNEEVRYALANFLDDFRANPSYDYIKDSILDLDNLTISQKAMFAGAVDSMCHEQHINRPEWIFDSRTYLDHPYFAMNAKGDFRVVLLKESPKWFRCRNIFVTANCLERV